jgi:hypothetical protein
MQIRLGHLPWIVALGVGLTAQGHGRRPAPSTATVSSSLSMWMCLLNVFTR